MRGAATAVRQAKLYSTEHKGNIILKYGILWIFKTWDMKSRLDVPVERVASIFETQIVRSSWTPKIEGASTADT
jgi:hypothetical protein